MDAFQGYYKDGTNGTPDWRYFSGLYLIFRILVIGSYILPMKYKEVYRVACYSSASLFFGVLRPYKEQWINYWDSIAMMLFSFAEFLTLYEEFVTSSHFALVYVLAVVPLVYLIVYTSYKLLSQAAILHHYALCCKNRIDEGRRAFSVEDVEREAYTDSEERTPLLTTAGNCNRV